MAAALAILRRDLLRWVRNPGRTALLFATPLVLAGLFGLVFGGGAGGDGITIRILLWDEDDSLLSRVLQGMGERTEGGARLDLTPVGPEGLEMMENGEASALLHIPNGFTDAYLEGRETTLGLVKNPAEQFLPQVVEEGVTLGAGLLSLASVVLRDELDTFRRFLTADGAPEDAAVAMLSTGVNRKIRELERYALPPVIELETATRTDASADAGDDGGGPVGILALFFPGLSMLGMLFIAQSATRDIQRDRAAGLVRHLLTAPVTTGTYVAGKCLSVLVATVAAFAILVAIGRVAGVVPGDRVAIAALIVSSALLASGLLLLLMSVARSERQGDALTTIVIIVAAMLGGAFMPLPAMPDFILPLARLSPVYWTVDGFMTVALDEGGVSDVLGNVAVLVVVGLGSLGAGALVLSRRIGAGGR